MRRTAAGAAELVLVEGAVPLRPEPALFESMLEGWRHQQRARSLSASLVAARERLVRRFMDFASTWPWEWTAAQLEAFFDQGGWAPSTMRFYQGSLELFLGYLTDPRYGWAEVCAERVGAVPAQIIDRWNKVAHASEYEGRPDRRPLTRVELQAFLDYADDRVETVIAGGHKGTLAAFRDATLFKVIYAFGLRRREAAMLDLTDVSANPAAPELGNLGAIHVRYAKANRGGPPRRRTVATVMPWAAEALAQYLDEVRPLYPPETGVVMWPTERGGRISLRHIDDRFGAFRAGAGLPEGLTVHCLRHSYVTHLVEDGVDPLFVQHQVGHSWASTTAVYTSVGSDHKDRMLRATLERLFDKTSGKELA